MSSETEHCHQVTDKFWLVGSDPTVGRLTYYRTSRLKLSIAISRLFLSKLSIAIRSLFLSKLIISIGLNIAIISLNFVKTEHCHQKSLSVDNCHQTKSDFLCKLSIAIISGCGQTQNCHQTKSDFLCKLSSAIIY